MALGGCPALLSWELPQTGGDDATTASGGGDSGDEGPETASDTSPGSGDSSDDLRETGGEAAGESCAPTTCQALRYSCGSASDGCTGTLSCGTCTFPETCGGGGTLNQC